MLDLMFMVFVDSWYFETIGGNQINIFPVHSISILFKGDSARYFDSDRQMHIFHVYLFTRFLRMRVHASKHRLIGMHCMNFTGKHAMTHRYIYIHTPRCNFSSPIIHSAITVRSSLGTAVVIMLDWLSPS